MNFIQKFIGGKNIPVIAINGVIDSKMVAKVTKGLKRINGNAQAVALVINSPGGSAVQSDLIQSQVTQFCKNKKLPLYTFAEDMAVSGGYLLLAVGDHVYVDENSWVGSVGVIMSKMGVKPLLDSHKIETRQFATKSNLLETLVSPSTEKLSEAQRQYISQTLAGTHSTFINHVEQHRKSKFTISKEERNKQIYNADIFTGQKAVDIGLADKIGNYQSVLFQEFPQATLDFVIKPTIKERFSNKGVMFNINLPGMSQVAEQNLSQTMNSQFNANKL